MIFFVLVFSSKYISLSMTPGWKSSTNMRLYSISCIKSLANQKGHLITSQQIYLVFFHMYSMYILPGNILDNI